MYFLLNDVVLSLELQLLTPPVMARRFSALSLDCVSRLGREIFAEEPKLQHRAVERGRRLALDAEEFPAVVEVGGEGGNGGEEHGREAHDRGLQFQHSVRPHLMFAVL